MKKLLIITTYYKPIQSVASNRMNAFAKYFNRFGYDVTVLTCSVDRNISECVEDGIRVVRLPNKRNGFWSAFDTNIKENFAVHYLKCAYNMIASNINIDSDATWTKMAIEKACDLMRLYEFDILLSSALPIGPHRVAMALKEKAPRCTWVADMRDAISLSRSNSSFYNGQMLSFEKRVLYECDYLLAVSKPQLELFKQHYSENGNTKFVEIRNGYDFSYEPKVTRKRNDIFSIIYAGSFYGAIKPYNFFCALENVLKANNICIKVRIIGNKAPIKIQRALKGVVEEYDAMPYDKICDEMKAADALLLICPSSLEQGIYTGKLFDYLGASTPIIALVPAKDVAAKLIVDSNSGYVIDNEDICGIEKVIMQAYTDWEKETDFFPDQEIVLEHQRSRQVKRLYDILENDLS